MILKTPNTMISIGPGTALRRAGVNIELLPGRNLIASCKTIEQAAALLQLIAGYAASGEDYLEVNAEGVAIENAGALLLQIAARAALTTEEGDPGQLPALRDLVHRRSADALAMIAEGTPPTDRIVIASGERGTLFLVWQVEPPFHMAPRGTMGSTPVVRVGLSLYERDHDTMRPLASVHDITDEYVTNAWHLAVSALLYELKEIEADEGHHAWEARALELQS